MTVNIKYKLNGVEHMLIIVGDDIEVDLITEIGLEIVQIPSEECYQGFRAKERDLYDEDWLQAEKEFQEYMQEAEE